MESFKEFSVNEKYKKVDIDLGGPYNISKLGYDANGNWSYMVSKGSGKPKKIQHQGEWDSKLTKGDSAEGSKIAKQITDYYDEFINEASLNSASQKKIDKLYASYKEQVKKSKGNLETLHYKIKTNFVNNEYTRASNQEIDYIWSLYKKETDKSLNERERSISEVSDKFEQAYDDMRVVLGKQDKKTKQAFIDAMDVVWSIIEEAEAKE